MSGPDHGYDEDFEDYDDDFDVSHSNNESMFIGTLKEGRNE